jgi:hypothetical protein
MSDLLLCFALFGTLLCSGDIEKDLNVSPFYNPVHYERVTPDSDKTDFVKPVVRYEFKHIKTP